MMNEIRNVGVPVREIVLKPLLLEDIQRLVVDSLQCEPGRAESLARLIHQRTGGNTLFANQFFTALAEEGFLIFDSSAKGWSWSLPHIRAQDFADHVVDLMADKLARLPENTQVALRQLACLGNSAKIATLKLVRGDSEEAIHGLGNQSLDYPRPWRTPLGEHKSLPRCNFSVRLADSQ